MFRRVTRVQGSRIRKGPVQIDVLELKRALGLPPVLRLLEGTLGRRAAAEALRTGKARVNEGAIWRLLAEKLYGSDVDAPVVATREALQNSRDAIDAAYKRGLVGQTEGRFEVGIGLDEPNALCWTDNGIGMDSDTVFDKFLSLGDTTKFAGGGEAGGFGIAKAIILGISTTFRWRLHTRDRLYIAEGFDRDVAEYRAPDHLQGVALTVYDLDAKWTHLGGDSLRERVEFSLALNTLNPRGRHAGIRLFTQDRFSSAPKEVIPRLRGRARHLVKATEAGPGTTMDVRAYPVQGSANELRVVRLDGLYQFYRWAYGTGVDLAFDLRTTLAPSADFYPLAASRTELSGQASAVFTEVLRQVRENAASATKEASTTESLALDQAEALEVERGLERAAQRLEALLADREFAARLQATRGAGNVYRTMQQELQRTRRRWEEARQARLEAEERRRGEKRAAEDRDFWPPAAEPPKLVKEPPPPPDLLVGALRHVKEKPLPRPRTNPWAGIATVDIDKSQWKAVRLRRYFGNPDRWIPHALAWKLACQMVLEELDERHRQYDIGFLFDDKAHAAYIYDGSRREHRLLINLEWLDGVVHAYRNQPLAVAAVLHGKACHEIAHMLEGGGGGHGEHFSMERERAADQTVGILYPLATAVRQLLRLQGAVPGGRRAAAGQADRRLAADQHWDAWREFSTRVGHANCKSCA